MSDLHTVYEVLSTSNAADIINEPLDHRILTHARRWHLVGVFLRCSICGEAQRASQSATAFPHYEGCEAGVEGDAFPWRDLAEILRSLPASADADARPSTNGEG